MAEAISSVAPEAKTQSNSQLHKKKSSAYPTPYTVPPTTQHTQTLILLHGRGGNGSDFGVDFLSSNTKTGQTLPELFPGMKFIFPTAKPRRAKAYNRAIINQWFDNVPIDEQGAGVSREQVEWQIDGLKETIAFLHPVIDEEVKAVGAKNVVIGGLSQGCAMAFHLLLSYQPATSSDGGNEKLGALGGFVGMSGWLPFAPDIKELLLSRLEGGESSDDDPFSTTENVSAALKEKDTVLSAAAEVGNFIRDIADLPPMEEVEPVCHQTPIFLGHGKHDEKVKIELSHEAALILKDLGYTVTLTEYNEGHWYKVPDQIDDIAGFLSTATK